MDQSAAVVASFATLANICGYSIATVRRAIDDLKADRWIEVIQIGGKGGANAYVINSRVAWAAPRSRLPMARFTATVLATKTEQNNDINNGPLRRIPQLLHTHENKNLNEINAIDIINETELNTNQTENERITA